MWFSQLLKFFMMWGVLVFVAACGTSGGGGGGSTCIATDASCSRSMSDPTGGCCSGTCQASGVSSVCVCLTVGVRCETPTQCCTGSCSGGSCTMRRSRPGTMGDPCTTSSQCEEPGQCVDGHCTCAARGEPCGMSGGLLCCNRVCLRDNGYCALDRFP